VQPLDFRKMQAMLGVIFEALQQGVKLIPVGALGGDESRQIDDHVARSLWGSQSWLPPAFSRRLRVRSLAPHGRKAASPATAPINPLF
jgi:hypothetical protein